MKLFISTLLVCIFSCTAMAYTKYVDGTSGNDEWDGLSPFYTSGRNGPTKTIFAALNRAQPCTYIIVADGIYTGQLNTSNQVFDQLDEKHCILYASNGPDHCVLQMYEYVRFDHPPSPEQCPTQIHGFTLDTTAMQSFGYGIVINGQSNAVISNCMFTNFFSDINTSIICACEQSRALIQDCIFENNHSDSILKFINPDCVFTVSRCTFRNNQNHPGIDKAIMITGRHFSNLILEDSVIEYNSSDADWTGIELNECTARIRRCTIENNYSNGIPQSITVNGIYAGFNSNLTLEDSMILNQTAYQIQPSYVRGIAIEESRQVIVSGCRIEGNGTWEMENPSFSYPIHGVGIDFIRGLSDGRDVGSISSNLKVTDSEIIGNNGVSGAGIRIERDFLGTIHVSSSNLSENNSWEMAGGGFYVKNPTWALNVTLDHCLIAQNHPYGICHNSYSNWDKYTVINHCTVAYNMFSGAQLNHAFISNSIFWGNSQTQIRSEGNTYAWYSNIQGNWQSPPCQEGRPCSMSNTEIINVNPQFTDPQNGDYHLKSQYGRYDPIADTWVQDAIHSPCIDMGNPADPVWDEPLSSGGTANLGAYGATKLASKSGRCVGPIYGDINRDCKIDLADIAILSANWLDATNHNMQLHLALNEPSGDIAFDSSSWNRHGTLRNSPSWNINGKFEGCLSFDGTNDYVEVTNYLGITGDAERTTCAWIKTTQNGTIFSYGTTGTEPGSKWALMVGSGKPFLTCWGGYVTLPVNSQVNIADGCWHHVAAVLEDLDRDGRKVEDIRFYVDGILQSDTIYGGGGQQSQEPIHTMAQEPVHIGAYDGWGVDGMNGFFLGQIDDVRIYGNALSQEDIMRLIQ